VSEKLFIWVTLSSVVTIAAVLLWLRDRSRAARGIPEHQQKLSQQRNGAAATVFGIAFWIAWFVFHALRSAGSPRVLYALVAIGSFPILWRSFRRYRELAGTNSAKKPSRETL
jgi:hypothetical protein